MAITTMDGLVAGLGSGERLDIYKASQASLTAGRLHSLWLLTGKPGVGATPTTGSGQVNTSATQGAIPFANPASGSLSYLSKTMLSCSNATQLCLYDRLVSTSGLNGTLTTAQSVNSVAITRPDATGAGAELYLEVYTALGSTAVSVTVSYTNSSGTSGRTTVTTQIPASVPAGFMLYLPLQAGDVGIQSVQTVTLAATTGTAGNFGITIARRIAEIPVILANVGAQPFDAFLLGMPQIYNNACLALMALTSTTSSGVVMGSLSLAKG